MSLNKRRQSIDDRRQLRSYYRRWTENCGLLTKLAFRNLWRNPLRTRIVLIALFLGVWAGTFAVAFVRGLSRQRLENQLTYSLGHLKITHPQFDEEKNTKFIIQDSLGEGRPQSTVDSRQLTLHNSNIESIIEFLKSQKDVLAFTQRINGYGTAIYQTQNATVDIYGINPETEKTVLKLYQKITQGKYIEKNARQQVVIGKKLAQKLKTGVGGKVVLQIIDNQGIIKTQNFRVIGIYEYHNISFESTHVFVNQADLAGLLGISSHSAHQIIVKLKDYHQSHETASTWQAKFPYLAFNSWDKTSPELAYLDELMRYFFWILNGAILLVLSLGIVNVMLMSILERQTEFKMLQAIGMSKTRLWAMIWWETFFLTATGSGLGVLASLLSLLICQYTGIDLTYFSSGLSAWGNAHIVYPILELADYQRIIILILITSGVSTICSLGFSLNR